MATASASQNSITVYWSSFGTTGNLATAYNVEIFRSSESNSNLVKSVYGLSSSTRQYSFSGLSAGTYYVVKVYAPRQNGGNTVERVYITTESPQVSAPSTPAGFYGSAGNGYVNFSWNSVYNADYYCLEITNQYGNMVYSHYSLTSLSATAYVKNGDTYYGKLYARNQGGNSYPTNSSGVKPVGNPPSPPSGFILTGKGNGYLSFSWNSVYNANSYNLEIFQSATNALIWGDYGLYSTSATCRQLITGVNYYAKLYSNNSDGNSSPVYLYNLVPTGNPPAAPTGFTNTAKGNGYLSFSWNSVYSASVYCLEIFHSATNEIKWRSYSLTSTSVKCDGLLSGVNYYAKLYANNNDGGNSTAVYLYSLVPTSNPPSTPTNFTVTSTGNGYFGLNWYSSTNAQYYCLEVYQSATNEMKWQRYDLTYTSVTVSGLITGVNYYAKLYAKNNDGNSGAVYVYNIVAGSTIPSQPTGLSARASTTVKGQITASWNTLSGATSYYVTVRENNYNGTTVHSSTITGTTFSVTLSDYKTYYVTCAGVNAAGTGNYVGVEVKTPDLTAPVITDISGDGTGKMYLSYSATDAGIGLRPTSTYYAEVSNANGTTYGQGEYQTIKYRTFIKDGGGNEFVHNSYYYMRVIVFDGAANTASREVRVQYKVSRPVSWSWTNPKVTGQEFNLTAAEWNSFCLRINQFRQYKGLANYNFTTVTKGSVITAAVINQAIYALSNITNAPALVSVGGTITATLFNTMTTYLNNIT